MTDRGLVLVVEDERAIADLVTMYLRRDGFSVRTECDGDSAWQAIRSQRPVAVILDIGVPGKDGIELCRELRTAGDWTPVLFMTARDDEVDRLLGLELGADDYVTKPFSPRELVARVRTVLRRASPFGSAATSHAGTVRLDPGRRLVWAGQDRVDLTVTEFDLLAKLMERPGQVWPRERLLEDVWGYAVTAGVRTVDVHIAQLRSKLGEDSPIRTVRGVGYAVDDT